MIWNTLDIELLILLFRIYTRRRNGSNPRYPTKDEVLTSILRIIITYSCDIHGTEVRYQ